jgi:RNA polymerase sigma factor (sigma-70 family)
MTAVERSQLRPALERLLTGTGSPKAMDEFFAHLRPYLHGIVRKVVGANPQGPLDHSNLVQSSLRRIFENFARIQELGTTGRVLGWIEKIVRNRIIDEVRRVSTRPSLLGSDNGAVGEPEPVEVRQARDREGLQVLAALNRLPEPQRLAIELRWFDRLPDAEIAQALGGSVNALRVLRFRALRNLRRLLEDRHGE